MNKIEIELEKFLLEYKLATPENKIIVGYSGGGDSACLLMGLKNLSIKYGFGVIAAHLNHNWRGIEADKEQKICLENAKKIAESGVELIIRTPVVPSFNDTAEEIRAISKFAATLPGVKEHHLLPYHRLGQDKYTGLDRNYALKGVEPPTQERMEYLLSVAEESGLKCQIGG